MWVTDLHILALLDLTILGCATEICEKLFFVLHSVERMIRSYHHHSPDLNIFSSDKINKHLKTNEAIHRDMF